MDNNLRKQLERNIANFRSQHPQGSKYYSNDYRYRSKLFRPKTRAAVRKFCAAVKATFFSTRDVTNIEPIDDANPMQLASADINRELLNFRLNKTMNWMLKCLGAAVDVAVNGVCIANVEWHYRERTKRTDYILVDDDGNDLIDEETGLPKTDFEEKSEVVTDKPEVDLVSLENFRFDPACAWHDPVNTSPYLIHIIPMYVDDILDMMEKEDPKTGQPKWFKYSLPQILSSKKARTNTTRQAREGNKQNPEDGNDVTIPDYQIVYVHRNIVRKRGTDWLFYTLGDSFILTKPVRLSDVYLHGIRPYVMGYCEVEPHKNIPAGIAELGQDIQTSANDMRNQRRDNINLVLNKRYHLRRGANIDLAALMSNVPGGGVLMEDPKTDVEVVSTPDVTSSSYQEEDRLNLDFDEITGQFSQSSVQSNRNLNETVGGLQLVSNGSNAMTEYMVDIFSNTFYEPVMRHIVRLEQKYETDEVILAIAARQAKLYQKYGIDQVTDRLLDQGLTTMVDAGIDATDPVRRIQKLSFAIDAITKAVQIQGANKRQFVNEIMGRIGYKTGERFFTDISEVEDERYSSLMAEIQRLTGIIQFEAHKADAKANAQIRVDQAKSQNAIKEAFGKIGAEIERMRQQAAIDMESASQEEDGNVRLERVRGQERINELIAQFELEMDKLRATHENAKEMAADSNEHDRRKVVYLDQQRRISQEQQGKQSTTGEA